MKKEFVPYELALELKQLGFDEKSICNWEPSWSPDPEHEVRMVLTTDQSWLRPGWVCAPTYSQAFRWFREKYDLFCYVELVGDRLFDYMIIGDFVEEEIDYEDGPFNTHEEAELACLQKLIEIVKTK